MAMHGELISQVVDRRDGWKCEIWMDLQEVVEGGQLAVARLLELLGVDV